MDLNYFKNILVQFSFLTPISYSQFEKTNTWYQFYNDTVKMKYRVIHTMVNQRVQITNIRFSDYFSSVQFSLSVVSNSLWPHGLQHARPPCPLPTPEACSNSCPLSEWCHPTISSSVVPFSSCLQSFPASGSFPVSQFLASGGQRIGVWASALPMNIQDGFPLRWTDLISLLSKGFSRVFSNTTVQKHRSFRAQLYGPTLISIHDYWKNRSFD